VSSSQHRIQKFAHHHTCRQDDDAGEERPLGHAVYEFGHIKSICFEKPETENCMVSKINMDRDRMFYSDHFANHIELSNPLYINGYISIFKEIVLERLKTVDKVNHRHIRNEMIDMYDREEWEWCLIWFKKHKYLNWEDKF